MNQIPSKNQSSPKTAVKWDLLILSVLLATGFARLFRTEITALLERMFGLIGKDFTSRSASTQTLAFFLVGGVLCCLLYLILCRVRERENTRAVIIICLAVMLVLTAILCFEQIIRRDDYWEIYDAQKYGFPGFIFYEYTEVNGRYFNLFLKSFFNFFDPQTYIRIGLLVNFILLGWGCTLLADRMLDLGGRSASGLTKIVLGTVAAAGIVLMSANIWEVWLWGAGMFIYGIAITMAIFVLVLYIDAIRGKPKYLLTLLVVTCACGGTELVTASVCAFGLGILILNRLFGERRWNKALILFMLWSWGCTAAVLLFSGSAATAVAIQNRDPNNAAAGQNLATLLIGLLPTMVRTLWGYVLSKKNYLLLFGLMALVFGSRFKGLKVSGKAWAGISLLLILTAGAVLMINLPLGYVPARVLSIPLDWVYLAVVGSCFILGSRLKIQSSALVPAICAVILCLHIGGFFRENIVMLDNNRLGWEYRDAQLKAADKTGTVSTCTLHVPGSVRLDMDEDPTYEFNVVTAYYYELTAVSASGFCPPITE